MFEPQVLPGQPGRPGHPPALASLQNTCHSVRHQQRAASWSLGWTLEAYLWDGKEPRPLLDPVLRGWEGRTGFLGPRLSLFRDHRNRLKAGEVLLQGCPGVLWLLPEGEACVLSREVQGRPREPWELAWVRKLIVKPERSVVKFIPSSAPAPAQGWGGAGPPAVAAARGGPRALSDGTRPFSQLSGAALAGQPRPGGQGLRRPQGPASPPAHQAGRQRT